MKKIRSIVSLASALCMVLALMPAASAADTYEGAHTIVLSSDVLGDGTVKCAATLDGQAVPEYDYTWHADPSAEHGEVKNAPAEYYTGTAPSGDDSVYIAHDIFYYPQLPASGFKLQNYDGEQEWCYYYTAAGLENRIFATLPVEGSTVPESMMHSPEEAYNNPVLHITKPGTYIIEGEWQGQIWVDLGDQDDTFADQSAKVKLVLNGVSVKCTVAPALVFYSVYECDNGWEDRETHTKEADLTDAGARVVIADGTENTFEGTNIYRMLRTKLKDENDTSAVPVQKKQRKTDGAFYSYRSMVIEGESAGDGVLNIISGYEGLDTELHLGINGGRINIYSDNDGINVNEDGVSVAQINGGEVHIIAGLGAEGDGIDSNGYLVINGGTVISMANPRSDSGMDSDFGSYVNGGWVASFGSTMDWAKADDSSAEGQAVMNLRFAASQSADEAVIITDTEGKVVFAYDPDKDEVAGTQIRSYQGAVISCPELTVGSSYNVYIGGDISGTENAGVYDVSSVSGFEGAVMQCYTGNTVGGFGDGFGGMGGGKGGRGEEGGFGGTQGGAVPDMSQPPDMGQGGAASMPQTPDGTIPDMGQGGIPAMPQLPGGDMGGSTLPQLPDGTMPDMGDMTRPGKGDFGGMGGFGQAGSFASCASPTVFEITEKVAAFSGVSDKGSHVLIQSADGSYYSCSVCGKSFSDANGTEEIIPPAEQGGAVSAPDSDKSGTQGISTAAAVAIGCAGVAVGIGAGIGIMVLKKKKHK